MSNIASELRRLASQENCDGEPYDSMMKAAAHIDRLEAAVRELLSWYGSELDGYIPKRVIKLLQHALAEPQGGGEQP